MTPYRILKGILVGLKKWPKNAAHSSSLNLKIQSRTFLSIAKLLLQLLIDVWKVLGRKNQEYARNSKKYFSKSAGRLILANFPFLNGLIEQIELKSMKIDEKPICLVQLNCHLRTRGVMQWHPYLFSNFLKHLRSVW